MFGEEIAIKAVADIGIALVGKAVDRKTVDLKPLVAGINELQQQGNRILGTLTHPATVRANELLEHAMTAFQHGWYEDALDDAERSINEYRYRAAAYLVAGLAAIGTGSGRKGIEMLQDAIKYTTSGEQEVGAIAALIACDLADAAGGADDFGTRLLVDADNKTGGRCPTIVAALAARREHADESYTNRLIQLWWDDPSVKKGTPPPYDSGGTKFLRYVTRLGAAQHRMSEVRNAVIAQVVQINTVMDFLAGAHGDLRDILKMAGIQVSLMFTSTPPYRHYFWSLRDAAGSPPCPDKAEFKASSTDVDRLYPPTPGGLRRAKRYIVYVTWTAELIATSVREAGAQLEAAAKTRKLPPKESLLKYSIGDFTGHLERILAPCALARVDDITPAIADLERFIHSRTNQPVVTLSVRLPPVVRHG